MVVVPVLGQLAATTLLETIPLSLLVVQCIVGLLAPDVCWPPQTAAAKVVGLINNARPGLRRPPPAVQRLIGRWRIDERHNMEVFLEELGYNSFMRSLLVRASQDQEIQQSGDRGDNVRFITSDLRGTTELELPLCGNEVVARDGDGGMQVCRSAAVKGQKLVVTERIPGRDGWLSICTRSLCADGRMAIDVQKRTSKGGTVAMRTLYARLP